MQEVIKFPESVGFVGIQKDDISSEENMQKLSIPPKRNRRVLIINEEIEIELEEKFDNEFQHLLTSQPAQVQTDSSEILQIQPVDEDLCLDFSVINPKIDDIEISETDLVSEFKDNETRKNNDYHVHMQKTNGTMDYHLEEYLRCMFRKIAPKECPNNTPTVDHENWRLSPPKKFKKKSTLNVLMENIGERKINLKKNYFDKSKSKIANRADKLKVKQRKILPAPMKSDHWRRDNYLNSLSMDDIKEGEVFVPGIAENDVFESSLSTQEIKSAVPLIICPYCRYKNPKEVTLKRHLILYHLQTKSCAECDFHSSSWQTMALHMSKHNNNVSRCPLCNEIVKSALVKNHIVAKHSKTILEQCRFCDFKVTNETFLSKISILREHVVSCHYKGKENEYNCPICNFTTLIDLEMKSHIYLSHSDLKGNFFRCLDCTFIAASVTNLLGHVGVHKKREKHVCVHCKFTNSSMLWMNLHKKLHNAVFYKCPYCQFRNSQNCVLKYHIQKWHKNNSTRALLKP